MTKEYCFDYAGHDNKSYPASYLLVDGKLISALYYDGLKIYEIEIESITSKEISKAWKNGEEI